MDSAAKATALAFQRLLVRHASSSTTASATSAPRMTNVAPEISENFSTSSWAQVGVASTASSAAAAASSVPSARADVRKRFMGHSSFSFASGIEKPTRPFSKHVGNDEREVLSARAASLR